MQLWPSPVQAAGGIWLEFEAPTERARIEAPVPLIEVSGRTGVGLPGHHDVVLLIDRSVSTFAASGVDINENGRVGQNTRNRIHPVLWTTDFGDTIIAAQLAAARGLIDRLDTGTTRMGIVTFGGTSRLRAPLGSSRAELHAALDRLANAPNDDGTYFYGALMHAIEELEAAAVEPRIQRTRSIVLLSDGVPTAPYPRSAAEKAAVHAARRAASAKVAIHAFALGPEAARRRDLFQQMTQASGGELTLVQQPGEVIYLVPHLSLTEVEELKIDNLSTSESARAVRLFPDGSFDGFAPLREGLNHLRITVTTRAGTQSVFDRAVEFAKTDTVGPQARKMLKTLEIRTIETELVERVRRKRREILQRSLQIEVEPGEPK